MFENGTLLVVNTGFSFIGFHPRPSDETNALRPLFWSPPIALYFSASKMPGRASMNGLKLCVYGSCVRMTLLFVVPLTSKNPNFGLVHTLPSDDSATHVTSATPSGVELDLPR